MIISDEQETLSKLASFAQQGSVVPLITFAQALTVLGIPALAAALIYWLLASVLAYFQGRLEDRVNRHEQDA